MAITIKKNILTNNDCYRAEATISPNSMQLHTIGTAQNSASALASYWNQPGIGACVHYCVDAETEGTVYQFLPDNRRSWADGGYGNSNSITVELMESDYMTYTGGANYTVTNEAKFKADITRAYNTAVEFFAMKCKEYGWNPQEKMSNGLHRVFSHDEGRRLGLSTQHTDPSHIWNRCGWNMDQFRADVVKAMSGVQVVQSIPTATVEDSYRVRKSWADSDSQLFAGTLEGAKKVADANAGYKVFDKNGKAVYPEEIKPADDDKAPKTTSTDKIWLGWTKRESGSAGFRQVMGDAGNACGKYQFDRRYALVPFMQYCVDYNASHYAAFKPYIALGAGSVALQNNSGLALAWTAVCNKYPREFEGLQDAYAYNYYYLEAKKYIKNLYGINMDNHSPAVKGTLFSMAIRSGALTGARKFYGCTDTTSDEHMLTVAYSAYGTADANRWTKAGQWGDALDALKNNIYTEVSVDGEITTHEVVPTTSLSYYRVAKSYANGVYTGQVGAYSSKDNALKTAKDRQLVAYNPDGSVLADYTPKSGYYRVAKSYANGSYVGQVGAYTNKDNALKTAKEKQLVAFNPDGSVLADYTPKPVKTGTKTVTMASLLLEKCKEMNDRMLADIKAGIRWKYSNTRKLSPTFAKARSSKNYYCNCAKMPLWALKILGVVPENAEGFYGRRDGKLIFKSTETKRAIQAACDIIDINMKKTVNQAIKDGTLQPGDIVTYYNPLQHTNIYAGNKKWYDSGHAYGGGSGEAPFKTWFGDTVYGGYKISHIIRLRGTKIVTTVDTTQYRVQVGSYLLKDNADNMLNIVKRTGLDVKIVRYDGEYVVQLDDLFSNRADAEKLVATAAAKGIKTIVKEV